MSTRSLLFRAHNMLSLSFSVSGLINGVFNSSSTICRGGGRCWATNLSRFPFSTTTCRGLWTLRRKWFPSSTLGRIRVPVPSLRTPPVLFWLRLTRKLTGLCPASLCRKMEPSECNTSERTRVISRSFRSNGTCEMVMFMWRGYHVGGREGHEYCQALYILWPAIGMENEFPVQDLGFPSSAESTFGRPYIAGCDEETDWYKFWDPRIVSNFKLNHPWQETNDVPASSCGLEIVELMSFYVRYPGQPKKREFSA